MEARARHSFDLLYLDLRYHTKDTFKFYYKCYYVVVDLEEWYRYVSTWKTQKKNNKGQRKERRQKEGHHFIILSPFRHFHSHLVVAAAARSAPDPDPESVPERPPNRANSFARRALPILG